MDSISKLQYTILNLVAASLFASDIVLPEVSDWSAIYQESYAQAVIPLVFSVAKSYIKDETAALWKQSYVQMLSNNIRIDYEHMELHSLLSEKKIPYVIMKGSASAAYYPEPTLRVMGDVDFLVYKSDLKKAGSILEKSGFVPVRENDNLCHIAYHREHSAWEMHWEPNGIPTGEVGALIRVYLSDMIDKAELYGEQDGAYMVPYVFHHGLILLLHTAEHLLNTGVGLRHLCDWAVFVNGISDDKFVSIFEGKLKAVGLWRFAQLLTLVSAKYLGCKNCSWTGEANDGLLEQILCDIFAGGNFGVKDSERINQAKLLTDHEKRNVDDTSAVKQFISTMNGKARIGMPVSQKYAFLLPIGWLYVGGRHIRRIITGKRPKIHVGKMVSGATERRKIYKQFRLFEPE